jgi:hypothetical protein
MPIVVQEHAYCGTGTCLLWYRNMSIVVENMPIVVQEHAYCGTEHVYCGTEYTSSLILN